MSVIDAPEATGLPTVSPVATSIGAEVSGVDLCGELPPSEHPDREFRRVMHRVVLAGDRPRGIDDVASTELDGADFP